MSDPRVRVATMSMTGLLWLRIGHFAGFILLISGLVTMAMMLRAGVGPRAKAAGILADVGGTLVLATGIYNAINGSLFSQPSLHIKLTLVAARSGIQIALRIKIKRDRPGGAGALLAATLILAVGIVGLVVIRPLAR